MFFAPRKPTTTVFTMLFASGNKNHDIYNVFFAQTEQKQWYLRSSQHVTRSTFSMPKAIYSVLGLLLGFVEGAEGGPQMNSNRLRKSGTASLPFTSQI